MDAAILILLLLGSLTTIISVIGCFKFDDFLSRTHAAAITDTLSVILFSIALILHSGLTLLSLKLFIVLLVVFITGSTAIHLLGKSYLNKLKK